MTHLYEQDRDEPLQPTMYH